MTRAERFEEEKGRIIESCFIKKEEDGACRFLLEEAHLSGVAEYRNILANA